MNNTMQAEARTVLHDVRFVGQIAHVLVLLLKRLRHSVLVAVLQRESSKRKTQAAVATQKAVLPSS